MQALTIVVLLAAAAACTSSFTFPKPKVCPATECPRPPRVRPDEQNAITCGALENELFIDGGPDCQQTCATLFECCLTRHVAPVRECFCTPGYARAKDGVCIPTATWECVKLAGKSIF